MIWLVVAGIGSVFLHVSISGEKLLWIFAFLIVDVWEYVCVEQSV